MKAKPHQIKQISSEFTAEAEKFGVSLKNFRISETAVEFDMFANDMQLKDQTDKALTLKFGRSLSERNLGEEMIPLGKSETVNVAVELFNQQRYWECHEVMEGIWHKEKNPIERDVQQGVILAASALVHAQKNENDVCLSMFARALKKLNVWEKQDYHRMDIGSLKKQIRDMLESGQISYPRIS